VSVLEEVTLPDQPSAGLLHYEPLGGDGVIAPHSSYRLNNFELTGDASGGVIQCTVNMDGRFDSLVALVSTAASGVGISQGVGVRLSLQHDGFDYSVSGEGGFFSPDDASRVTWSPSPIFGVNTLIARWANSDAGSFKVDAIVYLFEKGVAQLTPLPQLLACLPRSGSLLPP